jgi:hypothetical protein
VVVEGAAPTPPPITNALAAKAADEAHVDALEKYGMPPDVPAIVNAGVDVEVATDTMPPVQDTEVTVPDVADVHVGDALGPPEVNTCPEVPYDGDVADPKPIFELKIVSPAK